MKLLLYRAFGIIPKGGLENFLYKERQRKEECDRWKILSWIINKETGLN